MKLLLTLFLTAALMAGCVDVIRSGRNAFHGGNVLVDESQKAGEIVIELGAEYDPFQGNGRVCGTCHKAQDKFGMSTRTRRGLHPRDPFFLPRLRREPSTAEKSRPRSCGRQRPGRIPSDPVTQHAVPDLR